ncbi:MAG: hypothetical protein E7330_07145 [Clostridiales bacterium]|nr:hypothetical protein [Clostridiales bacterium]
MQSVTVESFACKTDLAELLKRRLSQVKGGEAVDIVPGGHPQEVLLTVKDKRGGDAAADALAALLLCDAARFQLAGLVGKMSLTMREKRQVLYDAQRLAREELGKEGVKALSLQLRDYLSLHDRLNVEGFLLFRMKEYVRSLGRHAKTALDLLIEGKCRELLQVLRILLEAQQPRLEEISLILYADGTCIIADDTDSRIECEGCAGFSGAAEEIVNLLVSLAPQRLSVYDLSCGRCSHLCDLIQKVFSDRVRFFHK